MTEKRASLLSKHAKDLPLQGLGRTARLAVEDILAGKKGSASSGRVGYGEYVEDRGVIFA